MLSAAAGNDKVKAVATIDPWFYPYSKEIGKSKFRIPDPNQAVCIIETDHFAKQVDSITGSNQKADIEKFLAVSANQKLQERVTLKNAHSVH